MENEFLFHKQTSDALERGVKDTVRRITTDMELTEPGVPVPMRLHGREWRSNQTIPKVFHLSSVIRGQIFQLSTVIPFSSSLP